MAIVDRNIALTAEIRATCHTFKGAAKAVGHGNAHIAKTSDVNRIGHPLIIAPTPRRTARSSFHIDDFKTVVLNARKGSRRSITIGKILCPALVSARKIFLPDLSVEGLGQYQHQKEQGSKDA